MRFAYLVCVILVLVSCSSPGSRFNSVQPVRVTVAGSDFDVYVLGDDVRAIRMNFEVFPKLAVVGARAGVAIRLASGCAVIASSVSGDQAVMDARIAC